MKRYVLSVVIAIVMALLSSGCDANRDEARVLPPRVRPDVVHHDAAAASEPPQDPSQQAEPDNGHAQASPPVQPSSGEIDPVPAADKHGANPKTASPSATANKVLDERPPMAEAEYRSKYGELSPSGILIVPAERRYYRYIGGERIYWNEVRQLWLPGEP